MPPLLMSRSSRVEGPWATCPKCAHSPRWRAYFTEWRLELTCDHCKDTEAIVPPSLDKLVLYLDQWVVSELANSLDPVLKAKKGKRDQVWMDLYRAIEQLVKLQAAVCPVSPLHREEGVVTPYAGILLDLHEHLACGARLREPLTIHSYQLFDAFERSLHPNDPKEEQGVRQSHALDGSVNQWSDDMRISVRFPIRDRHRALERATRSSADKHLADDFTRWQQQPGRSFAEWYAYHRRDLTNVVLSCWEQGYFGVYTSTCESMVRRAMRDGAREKDARALVRAFLQSDVATLVPYCDISSLLFAGLSKKIADEGQKRVIDHSHHNDVHAIAAYLPYSDVICVDSYFRELLAKKDIQTRIQRYGTVVFSPNSVDAFLSWLRAVRETIPQDLRNTVLAVYGEHWLKPYDAILEYSRQKGH